LLIRQIQPISLLPLWLIKNTSRLWWHRCRVGSLHTSRLEPHAPDL